MKNFVLPWGWGNRYLNNMVREGISEEMLFEQRPECWDGANHEKHNGIAFQEEETARAKLWAGEELVFQELKDHWGWNIATITREGGNTW